jgi:hypothetical protein
MECKNTRRFTSFDTAHVRLVIQGICLDNHSSTLLVTRRQKEVGGQHEAPAALPKKRPGTNSTGDWWASGPVETEIENLAPPALDPLTSPHGLRYPGRHSNCGTQI